LDLDKRKKDRIIDIILLFGFLLILRRGYFYSGIKTRGDWSFHFKEQVATWFLLPYAWLPERLLPTAKTMWLTLYPITVIQGFLAKFLGLNFSWIERIVFFFPVAFLPALSMYYLSNYLFKKRIACLFSAIFYSSNTYILVSSITHLHMAMAYSLAPLVLALFIQSLQKESVRKAILTSIYSLLGLELTDEVLKTQHINPLVNLTEIRSLFSKPWDESQIRGYGADSKDEGIFETKKFSGAEGLKYFVLPGMIIIAIIILAIIFMVLGK